MKSYLALLQSVALGWVFMWAMPTYGQTAPPQPDKPGPAPDSLASYQPNPPKSDTVPSAPGQQGLGRRQRPNGPEGGPPNGAAWQGKGGDSSQSRSTRIALPGQGQQGPGRISGQIVDGAGKPVGYATVSVLKPDSSLVGGILAADDGSFTVDKLPVGNYRVRITFLGYGATEQAGVQITEAAPTVKLGKVLLAEQAKKLGEVEITAEKPVFSLGIDRKTFDVSRSNLNPGGNASDVLANVPTVTVDVDGNVSMRNNENVTLYIDGRPSGITGANRAAVLKQIPASAIDRIELITSPSARYDAEGVSGIINIILKKNRLEGFTGTAQASAGTRGKTAEAFNLAYRNSHVNAYVNYNYRYNKRYGYGTSDRYSFLTDSLGNAQTLHAKTNSNQTNYESGHFVKIGSDFFLPKDNTLGVSGTFAPNRNSEYETNHYSYQNGAGDTTRPASQRYSETHGHGINYEATLTHIKKYDSKGHEWSSQANYADFSSSSYADYLQDNAIATDPTQAFLNAARQHNNTSNTTRSLTVQTDYVHPYASGTKFELGAKSSTRDILTDYQYYAADSTGVLHEVTSVRNRFRYTEQIAAGYGIFGHQYERFGFQAGIRGEQTWINAHLLTPDTSIPRNYFNLFPSINASYKLSKQHELQASYSRRINRPGGNSLNPFRDFTDPLTVRTGNPALLPELIDAYEATWQYTGGKVTFSTTGFFRETHRLQTRIIHVEAATGRSFVTQENAGTRYDEGVEVVGRWQVIKGWSITGSGSLFASQIHVTSTELPSGLVPRNTNYNFRILSNAQIAKKVNFQLTTNYRSPFILPQGTSRPMYSTDAAISYDVLKGKGTISLAGNDLFNTMRFGIHTSQAGQFDQLLKRKRETQIGTITFVYRFGNQQDKGARQQQRQGRGAGQGQQGGGDFF